MSVKEVFLEGNPPWGFRMNGGADAGHPLRISRVNPGSKAEAKGVREGDLITSINGQSTKCLTNSESHALLRTVKENLLLGLNEDKNSSPRRRSREIKSASIISQEKERSESPTQHKGKLKSSECQRRHQRRTRLKHRIKGFFGLKTKEKKVPEDEGWIIIDSSMNSHETRSVSEIGTDDETKWSVSQPEDDSITNNSEEIYDNFVFKKNRESSLTPIPNMTPTSEKKINASLTNDSQRETCEGAIKDSKMVVKVFESDKSFDCQSSSSEPNINSRKIDHQGKKISMNFIEHGKKMSETNDLWILRNDCNSQCESKAIICESEDFSETLNIFPSSELIEVCNAKVMIEEDNQRSQQLQMPIIVTDEEDIKSSESDHCLNLDYEPVEVASSVIVYPPYGTTLSYYFPQRRYLEVISEENSDLSESTEEKQDKFDKPWENAEMIRKANDIPAIPNDWFGSDDGIDTSWRDGKSLEEVSDVAAVSDSFSDSDFLSEDLKLNRGVGEDGTIKYSISKSKVSEPNQQCSKHNVVLGKPPIIVNTYKVDNKSHSHYKGFDRFSRPTGTINDLKLKINKDEPKIKDNKRECPVNKVTCRVLRQNEIISNATKKSVDSEIYKPSSKNISGGLEDKTSRTADNRAITDEKVFKKIVLLGENNTHDLSKLPCQIIEQPGSNCIDKTANDSLAFKTNLSGTNLNQYKEATSPLPPTIKPSMPEKKYMKSIPSSNVLKNVVLSYYNCSSERKEAEIMKKATGSHIEFSTAVIEPSSERDIELIYIDSSDSDALSDANKSNYSVSNRTSLTLEKDNISVSDEPDCLIKAEHAENIDENKNNLIKEEIININQSVKNISDMCSLLPENNTTSSIKNKTIEEPLVLPNLLSPVLNRKSLPKTNVLRKRRFSYPMSEQDLLKTCHEISCYNCSNTAGLEQPSTEGKSPNNERRGKFYLTPLFFSKQQKILDSPKSTHKLSLRSLPNTPPPYVSVNTPNRYKNQSTESILLEFSDGSVSSESYTLPDVAQDNDLSDVSSDTIKYFNIPSSSPKTALPCSLAVSEIVDLHKKFLERRGYHEVSPILKRKLSQESEKTPEPDLISLSKVQDKSEQAYTPELLAEAANLLALHKYHESRQRKMKSDTKNEVKSMINVPKLTGGVEREQSKTTSSKKFDGANETEETNTETSKQSELSSEKGLNGKIIDLKEVNKSVCTENETVGKSRLLELFQKLESKSSTTEYTLTDPEPFPCCFILEDNSDFETLDKLSEESEIVISNNIIITETISNQKPNNLKEVENIQVCKKEVPQFLDKDTPLPEKLRYKHSQKASIFVIHPTSIPPGEIFQRKMYEEYLGKMAELAERRNMKVIKVSSVPSTANPPCENQLLESEFMSRLKERNEKLGIVIDGDETIEKISEAKDEDKGLPKHLKELMEITEECGGVWSPAQTPEAERKKFDFASEIREEKEREKQKEEEEEKQEPSPPVWTPRSAGPSPTLERKFRTVNFTSPPPSRKEIKTPNETPKLPKDLPLDSQRENNSKSRLITSSSENRLTSSSSENSTLSSSLRLPAAQNPTITLLQKAREGQIPRGAQYLEDQPTVGPNEIIYSVKKEHVSENKKIVELGPRKIEGIGPTTEEGIPTVLRSEVKEDNQQRWYKRMYDSLHKADGDKDFVTVKYKTRRGQYPYSYYSGGYSSEPERIGYDSDASLSKYATLDRRKIRNKENDFTTSTMPRNRYASGVKYAVDVYKNQPGRIEDYEPGNSSISDKEKKQWWDEVMDIFDGEVNETRSNHFSSSKYIGKPYTYSLKDTGYESDSTLVFKRRENNMSGQLLSPSEQKMAYKVIQKGGEVPFQGLRKTVPERPKEPLGNSITTTPRDSASRQRIQESPHRYVESEVNIHYKSPVRREAKAAWPEDELAQRQAEIMRRIYQEQKRTKYLNELHDMYSRRHADNLLPSQKSPIPLNRYDDFPVEVQPPRPRDRTPEPKLVARALYNFVGQTSRELSFRRGDIIYVRRQIDKNWYEGEHNAMIGLFPFNYVEIIPYDGIRTLPKKANEGQARAKFNFQAQTHLELSLVKGELVLLTRRVDENWFEGRIGKRKGIFPVSYVEVLVEPGERSEPPSRVGTPSKPLVAPASHSVMLNGAKDLGQQHYQPPRPIIYSSSSLPPSSKIHDIGLVNQTLHIDTQSDPVPYRVLYNYTPKNDDELELKEGDVVYVMEKCDDGWYVGSLHRNGQFGTFPGNFVERIQ